MDSQDRLIALDDTMDSETLQHYGVKGMKWGIRRAKKKERVAGRRKGTTNDYDQDMRDLNDAEAILKKHRAKATDKISKLEKKGEKLQKEYDKRISSDAVRAPKLEKKAARKLKKANKWYTSKEKAMELEYDARRLEVKAKTLSANAKSAEAKLKKNQAMIDAFNRGLKDIDNVMVEVGRRRTELNIKKQYDDILAAENAKLQAKQQKKYDKAKTDYDRDLIDLDTAEKFEAIENRVYVKYEKEIGKLYDKWDDEDMRR